MSGTVCDERNRATSQSLVSCSHIPIRGKMSSTPSPPTPFLLTYSGPSSWRTYIQPANSFYLPHLKGAGIENFKVRNRGGYSCHLSGTAWCAVSPPPPLFSFAPVSCLFLQTGILYFSVFMESSAVPVPGLTSPLRFSALTPTGSPACVPSPQGSLWKVRASACFLLVVGLLLTYTQGSAGMLRTRAAIFVVGRLKKRMTP